MLSPSLILLKDILTLSLKWAFLHNSLFIDCLMKRIPGILKMKSITDTPPPKVASHPTSELSVCGRLMHSDV